MTSKPVKRVVFTFDERSLENIDKLIAQGRAFPMKQTDRFASIEAFNAWQAARHKQGSKPQEHITRLVATEEQEQMALFARVRLHLYQYPQLNLLFHVKNEGTTWSHAERQWALQMGILPGMTDLVLLYASRGYHGWAGELKTLDGKPTSEQLNVIRELRSRGYFARILYGQDEAWESLMWYLGEKEHE